MNLLNPIVFAEHGRLRGIWEGVGGIQAIASSFDRFYWPGRAVYERHHLRHRLTLHRQEHRIACFDACDFPILDVAFHPSQPLVAIATGAYDGGLDYQGALWIWDYEDDNAWTVFGESREVRRCRFLDAERLSLLLAPPTDEETVEYGGVVTDWRQGRASGPDPRLYRFVAGDKQGFSPSDAAASAAALQRPVRGCIWDLAWRGDEVLAAHQTAAIEGWHLDGSLQFSTRGLGFQILRHQDTFWVHHRVDHTTYLSRLRGSMLTNGEAFQRVWAMSINHAGRFLLRGADNAPDWVFRPGSRPQVLGQYGYDVFNHYLRLDGQKELFYLSVTPPDRHLHKRLCWIDAAGAHVQGPAWDPPNSHFMCNNACFTPDGLLRSGYLHHPHPGKGKITLGLFDIQTGEVPWERRADGLALAFAPVPGTSQVIYALTSGTIGMLDTSRRETIWERPLLIDGLPAVATALAVSGKRLAIGTGDGRVLVTEVG